jgi:Ca2+-binding RTX toxin-like protein
VINAGAGDDYIHGGSGADTITGGSGADLFVYKALFDSKPTSGDVITDFVHGVDKMDLSAIDANVNVSGNSAFTYVGENAFSGHAGELRVDHSDSTKTIVSGDVNGDKVADFSVTLTGHIDLTSSDFIL